MTDTVTLNNGVKMPQFGLGVWKAKDGPETENEVRWALECGYRHIDTASLYGNEKSVGKALKDSGIARSEVFLTTKVWNPDQGYDNTMRSFEKSLELLGTDYVDLYLIHYPVAGKFLDTWKALEEIYRQGRAKAIGVSNFLPHHLEELMEASPIVPAVNQVELHPYFSQRETMRFCMHHGIQVEAWSPIAQGTCLKEGRILAIAQKYEKSAAQIVLRWELQQGIIIIPKSVRKERIIENSQIFDFSLTDQEMKILDNMNLDLRIGPDPETFVE